jgi:septal ring factor EnvC (AmiA/AmiB activator)
MTEPNYELIRDILRNLQADVSELKKMRHEMREGFASIRSHLVAMKTDHGMLERRLMDAEIDIDRVKTRLDLNDDPDAPRR